MSDQASGNNQGGSAGQGSGPGAGPGQGAPPPPKPQIYITELREGDTGNTKRGR